MRQICAHPGYVGGSGEGLVCVTGLVERRLDLVAAIGLLRIAFFFWVRRDFAFSFRLVFAERTRSAASITPPLPYILTPVFDIQAIPLLHAAVGVCC